MNKTIKQAAVILAAAVLAAPAFAAQETFDLKWSGASLGDGATAVGKITIDTGALSAGSGDIDFPDSRVSNFTVTVSGASAGNGTFDLSDFSFMAVDVPSALDLSKELVGQALTDGSTWGESNEGAGGDFNFFAGNDDAPTGTWWFTLTSADGQGDGMVLTSMSAVPEAQNLSLMLAGLGLVGFAARRRKLGA